MGHKKNKKRFGAQGHPQQQSQPIRRHNKARFSTGTKVLLAIFVILIIGGVSYWQFGQPSNNGIQTQGQYPQTVAAVFYTNPTTKMNGTIASFPYEFAGARKLVFLDLKLKNPTNELSYQGHSIPLELYKGGQYLPVVVISTPLQKVIAGIRVCEPCGSFSFHIVQGKYLDCDACHTQWDIETLKGVSGGCPDYPPRKLPTSINNGNIEIDISPLGMSV